MSDVHTADDDRRILCAAPADSDDWDDSTWAAWFRCAERANGERFDGDTKAASPSDLLVALTHSARMALTATKQGQPSTANEHVDAIERLVGAYRAAAQPEWATEVEQLRADCERKDREFATCERLLREAYEEIASLRRKLPPESGESGQQIPGCIVSEEQEADEEQPA